MATSDILNALSSSGLGTGQGIDVTATVNQLIANLRGPSRSGRPSSRSCRDRVPRSRS